MPKKKTLNPNTEEPKSLSDLTLDFMLAYVKAKGTKEDKEWYIKTVERNWGKKYNNLAKKEIEGVVNIPALRKEFADKFFPNLIAKKNGAKKVSYLDSVKELLK